MNLIRHRPSAPLDRYVECLWWSRREVPSMGGEHLLPTGRAQLVFALHELPFVSRASAAGATPVVWSRGVVHGPQGAHFLSGPKPAGGVVGVSFKPGMAGAVLGVPSLELVDRHVPVEDLWGPWGRDLQQRLCEAPSPAAALELLQRALRRRLERPLLIHPAVAQALMSGTAGERRIADLQRQSGYSARHFIALFRCDVGLTPKHYFRVLRFGAALKSRAAMPQASLADLSAAMGYADQAHMSREFRELAGITPAQYRPPSAGSPFHHRMDDGPG